MSLSLFLSLSNDMSLCLFIQMEGPRDGGWSNETTTMKRL